VGGGVGVGGFGERVQVGARVGAGDLDRGKKVGVDVALTGLVENISSEFFAATGAQDFVPSATLHAVQARTLKATITVNARGFLTAMRNHSIPLQRTAYLRVAL
jgi:hypothetical protein